MGGSSGFLMRVVDDSMTSSPAWNRNHAIPPVRPSNYAIRSVAVNVQLAEGDPGSPLRVPKHQTIAVCPGQRLVLVTFSQCNVKKICSLMDGFMLHLTACI